MLRSTDLRQDAPADYSDDFPGIAHIVADLDDLETAVPMAVRSRRADTGPWQRLASASRHRLVRKRVAALSAIATLAMAVAACSDANDPVHPLPPATVERVGVKPLANVLPQGATLQLTPFAFDSAGRIVSGRLVSWETDAPETATVSATGLVRALRPGYADITATIDGRRSSSAVTVTEPE